MKHFLSTMLCMAFSCTMCFAQFNGAQTGEILNDYSSMKNINYVGDGKEYHNCDIYYPNDGKEKHPVLIHIYGSAWSSNNSKDLADLGTIGKTALENGYIFVTPNHRSSSDAQWPAQSHDIKACIRYIRGNAESLGVDTSFIAISGFSSGGHLASVMGTSRNGKVFKYANEEMDLEGSLGEYTMCSSSVDAVCDWSGPVDLLDMQCNKRYTDNKTQVMEMPQMEENLVGCKKSECTDKFHLLNAPTFIDPTDCPFMLVHGASDNVVPQCQSIEFNNKLQDAGVYTEFYTHSGGHSVNSDFTDEMVAFLGKAQTIKQAQVSSTVAFDHRENFHVYIAIGQSNMWGNAKVVSDDKQTHDRITMMSTANSRGNVGEWIPAVPPMCAPSAGYSLADNFIREMAKRTPDYVTTGIIPVAIAGTSFKIFDPDMCDEYLSTAEGWLQNMAAEYDSKPYERIIACAKKAQQTGVIKGIIVHQGETDNMNQEWLTWVTKFYNNVCADLNLDPDKTPILVGQMVPNGSCQGHNSVMANLPNYIKNCAVVQSSGLQSESDKLHFTHDSYTQMGKRYADEMCNLLGFKGLYTIPSTPYKGQRTTLPGKIEVENYDEGGNNIAWYDATSGNSDEQYRSDDVDIRKEGSDYVVTKVKAGEWMKYSVTSSLHAAYYLSARVALPADVNKAKLTVLIDNLTPLNVTINKPEDANGFFELSFDKKLTWIAKGDHEITITANTDGLEIDWIQLTKEKLSFGNDAIGTVEASKFAIVPNPASTIMSVYAETEVNLVEVYNTVGALVLKTTEATGINISDLPSGVYFVKVNSMVERLVITK